MVCRVIIPDPKSFIVDDDVGVRSLLSPLGRNYEGLRSLVFRKTVDFCNATLFVSDRNPKGKTTR
jgi:hypothetical protein